MTNFFIMYKRVKYQDRIYFLDLTNMQIYFTVDYRILQNESVEQN